LGGWIGGVGGALCVQVDVHLHMHTHTHLCVCVCVDAMYVFTSHFFRFLFFKCVDGGCRCYGRAGGRAHFS